MGISAFDGFDIYEHIISVIIKYLFIGILFGLWYSCLVPYDLM